ncbi:hypothetical protein KTO58_18780 [Chitinophaga pendula]|uniref:hypothetical protein n=1 Tax=Chitinophaga TaxID=79328 RepID=UPI000BAF315B|nr:MULTISPECIES: hypothetical protein [Chitinophaga]ASZ11280.1 hypothetical protein CK934_10030 [Chitinophaga sp. MD30]UCJ05720.1 hypothetical protein KTO58_18780 [Chitinophaga pendula]
MYKQLMRYLTMTVLSAVMVSCSKVNYTKVDNPAYLRVFNNLNYIVGLSNKDEPTPFLTMLIDPVLDKDGIPIGAAIKGDFLDKRDWYAPPYPSHIGSSTSVKNPEYPGKEDVPVAPVLNGFDLSSWAQIPSGKHRFLFLYRPNSNTPFFELEPIYRRKVMIDTVLELSPKEVYTMHILQQDFKTKRNGLILRQENFHKQSLSDSMIYVNCYNMSAKGFWEADNSLKPRQRTGGTYLMEMGLKDQLTIWYSLFKGDDLKAPVPGYLFNYLATVYRDTESSAVAPYYSIPLFPEATGDKIYTDVWQRFSFFGGGIHPSNNPYNDNESNTYGNYGLISCYKNGQTGAIGERGTFALPNMIVNIHSGVYNPRSFATVNTIEIVNGVAYLTTIQRKYAPPIY